MKSQDLEDLKQLVEFLKEYQVAEFDLDRGDLKIRLKFSQSPAASNAGLAEFARLAPSAPAAVPASPSATAPASEGDADLHIVKSPIVGTFYSSPAPGADAFVSPGDHVEKGQVLCIIEAMKLMNEVEADVSGEIVRCLVTDGQAIEYGQPLFALKTV